MKSFLIHWTADTLEGKQWGDFEFESPDPLIVAAQEWAWRHLDIVTGLNLKRVQSLSIHVEVNREAV